MEIKISEPRFGLAQQNHGMQGMKFSHTFFRAIDHVAAEDELLLMIECYLEVRGLWDDHFNEEEL